MEQKRKEKTSREYDTKIAHTLSVCQNRLYMCMNMTQPQPEWWYTGSTSTYAGENVLTKRELKMEKDR